MNIFDGKKGNLRTLNLSFNSKEAVGNSISKMLSAEGVMALFVLAAVKNLLVKNKEGVHISFLCYTLSQMVTTKGDMDFGCLIKQLITYGFLSIKEFLDEYGDKDANVFLANSKIGDYAECELIKEFPKIKREIFDKLKCWDIEAIKAGLDEMRAASSSSNEGDGEVKH